MGLNKFEILKHQLPPEEHIRPTLLVIFLFIRVREIQFTPGYAGRLTLCGIKKKNRPVIYSQLFVFILGPSCPVFL